MTGAAGNGARAVRLRLRFTVGPDLDVGPGRMDLLEAVAETGSISAAARRMGMSYRRAWVLIDHMNQHAAKPLVEKAGGGRRGGGTRLTDAGRAILDHYRAMEKRAGELLAEETARLEALLNGTGEGG